MRINYNNTYLSKIKKQKDRYLHATQKWATQELPDNFTNNNRQFYREEYLKSDHWKNLRYCKLQQVCYCEMCDNTSTLDVHHINYKNLYDVELEDLMVLCRKCHVKVHDDAPNVSKWDKFNNVPELLTEKCLLDIKEAKARRHNQEVQYLDGFVTSKIFRNKQIINHTKRLLILKKETKNRLLTENKKMFSRIGKKAKKILLKKMVDEEFYKKQKENLT